MLHVNSRRTTFKHQRAPAARVNSIFLKLNVRPQGPVVRTPVTANPELNFNPGLFFFLSKALSRIVFAILFRVSNHQVVGEEN